MQEPTSPITWAGIIALALSSGVIASTITQGLSTWREFYKAKQDRNRDATYLAIRVAVILEQFATDCAMQLADLDAFKSSRGAIGNEYWKLPTLPAYPEELSWGAIDSKMCERMLSFTTEVRIGQSFLVGLSEFEPTEVPIHCGEKCAVLGFRAWILARDLRARYRVRPFELPGNPWKLADMLKPEHDRVVDKAQNQ